VNAATSTVSVTPALADALTHLVAQAGCAALALAAGSVAFDTKADLSPVTAADLAADAILADGLARLLPGLTVISEEKVACAPWGDPDSFALVDPLDGTKEFVAGRTDYAVNLAILVDRYPVAGFIAVPALGWIYRGLVGQGAERLPVDFRASAPLIGQPLPIRTRTAPAAGLVAAVSRSHCDPATQALLTRLSVADRLTCGSALKFCRLAEGTADVYARLSPTSEWDIAAGHAIVAAAGGAMTAGNGEDLSYGHAQTRFLVRDFIAWGDPAFGRQAPVSRS
jgi:3'(2'), 5'-bisphosphate nucleotidase